MNEVTKTILAGLIFGVWPLIMNRSGLSGNISAACFSGIALIGILPFAIHSNGGVNSIPEAKWTLVLIAGLLGAVGLLCFNGMLATASPKKVGMLLVVMTVVQIAVPALYQVVMSGNLSLSKAVGFLASSLGVYLLLR